MNRNGVRLSKLALGLALSSLGLSGCAEQSKKGQNSTENTPALRGSIAPLKELDTLGDIGQFEFTNQANEPVKRDDFKGKIWVASFFFTRCPVICPRITNKLKEIQQLGADEKVSFQIVSFSVDPENDTPEALRAYAEKYSADLTNWHFLTGDYEGVKRTSVQGFKMALEGKPDPAADHFGILHGSHLVLVDGTGQIRGFYRSEEAETPKKILTDIQRLQKLTP